MKPFLLCTLLSLPLFMSAQRVFTFDPEKDILARKSSQGALEFAVPMKALILSIQEAIPQISDIQTVGLEKIGKSNYLIASGKERERPAYNLSIAVLLAETATGEFQADNLVISCSSAGDCRECSLPPLCTCNKGEGSCGQNIAMMASLKKVTVTLFD